MSSKSILLSDKSSANRPKSVHCTPAVELLEGRVLFSLAPVAPDYPLVTYNSTGVLTYDASTDALDITATPLRFRETSSSPVRTIKGIRDLQLHVLVDNTGALLGGVSGDDFAIIGDIDIDGDGTIDFSGTLLTGEVKQMGFEDSGPTTDSFEFVFGVTGGALASYYAGKDIGITVLSENSSFANSFETNFSGGAKGNIGTSAMVFNVPPVIDIVKSGPTIAHAGTPLTYNYSVTNPGQMPLSDVSVLDDKAGLASYVSGDVNSDSMLQPDETWVFSATYTPEFTSQGPLVNVAIASGTFGELQATAQDSYTLSPVTVDKDLFLYWDNAGHRVAYNAADDTPFTVEVVKGGNVIDTFQITQSALQGLWLSDGDYSFKEINLPAGYISAIGEVAVTAGTQSEVKLANVVTFDLAVNKTGPAKASAGQTIAYMYEVTNAGPAKVRPVLNDDLAGVPVYVSGDEDGDGLVSTEEVWVYTANYTVPTGKSSSKIGCGYYRACQPPTTTPTSITNIVTVDAVGNPHLAGVIGGDVDLTNNRDTWTVQIGKCSPTSSLSGQVFLDWNNNGLKNCPDWGISRVKIILSGVDESGNKVCRTTYTDCRGFYTFDKLNAGVYSITESQPCGLLDGKETLGSLGGIAKNNQFTKINLGSGQKGTGYNFAELLRSISCGGKSGGGHC